MVDGRRMTACFTSKVQAEWAASCIAMEEEPTKVAEVFNKIRRARFASSVQGVGVSDSISRGFLLGSITV